MTRPELNAARAADFEESPLVKLGRLERTLADERKFAVKSTRQLHRAMLKDVRAAEKRARDAEAQLAAAKARAAAARRRARQLEAELEALKQSSTWRVGRAVVAVPARIRRSGRR